MDITQDEAEDFLVELACQVEYSKELPSEARTMTMIMFMDMQLQEYSGGVEINREDVVARAGEKMHNHDDIDFELPDKFFDQDGHLDIDKMKEEKPDPEETIRNLIQDMERASNAHKN